MWTVQQKAQFVLWYAELKSVVAVQRKWRSSHPGEKPPMDKALNRCVAVGYALFYMILHE
jgi:hypothetical protein